MSKRLANMTTGPQLGAFMGSTSDNGRGSPDTVLVAQSSARKCLQYAEQFERLKHPERPPSGVKLSHYPWPIVTRSTRRKRVVRPLAQFGHGRARKADRPRFRSVHRLVLIEIDLRRQHAPAHAHRNLGAKRSAVPIEKSLITETGNPLEISLVL